MVAVWPSADAPNETLQIGISSCKVQNLHLADDTATELCHLPKAGAAMVGRKVAVRPIAEALLETIQIGIGGCEV